MAHIYIYKVGQKVRTQRFCLLQNPCIASQCHNDCPKSCQKF